MILEDIKVQLSALEFIHAITDGKALDNTGKEHFYISTQRENRATIYFNNIEVIEDVKLEQLECFDWIFIVSCKFKSLTIESCEFKGGLEFQFCNISQGLSLIKSNVEKTFTLNTIEISKDFNITWGTTVDDFLIESSVINGSLYINNAQISKNLKILDTEFKNRLHIYNQCFIANELTIENVRGKDLRISAIKVFNYCNIWHSNFEENIDIQTAKTMS